jgi:hypothetical protein
MPQILREDVESIAGAAFVALGIFIFYENLHRALTELNLLGAIPREELGVLPTVILTISRVVQAYAADHQRFLLGFLHHTLVTSWPLLLVMVGKVLLRDASADNLRANPKKDCRAVDLTAARSTLR